jgi:hypothetical protein
MKPKPWSFSALDTFKTCPRQYEAKYVSKSVQEEKSEQMLWGERVHKAFELRQLDGTPLPDELADHEPYMQKLEALDGVHNVEQKIALNRQLQPTNFFASDVWFRGIIDYIKVGESGAYVVDYKTGKPHQKFDQLMLFAIHTFILYPETDLVHVRFYWTQTFTETRSCYRRDDIKGIWNKFIPDLRQFAEAFKTDTWQPRQSGLCNGWCPVKECEFWKPKRK